MLWDINPNSQKDKYLEVEAPSAIDACRQAMPGRIFADAGRTRDGWWAVNEVGILTMHEVYERRSG